MGRYRTAIEWPFIEQHLPPGKLRVLDIGGSSGRFALPLADCGHLVTVVDLSQDAIGLLKAKNHPNITALHADFTSYHTDARFDVVLAVESAQFFPMSELASKIHSLLEDRGLFLFTDLNQASWRFAFRRAFNRDGVLYKIDTSQGYEAVLNSTGFESVTVEGLMWMPFRVNSNSPLVPVFAAAERMLGLRRWIRQSPWLFYAARKQLDPALKCECRREGRVLHRLR